MKKLILLLVFFISILSFQSCTDLTEDDETIFEIQTTEKPNNCNSTGCGQGGVEDDEEDD